MSQLMEARFQKAMEPWRGTDISDPIKLTQFFHFPVFGMKSQNMVGNLDLSFRTAMTLPLKWCNQIVSRIQLIIVHFQFPKACLLTYVFIFILLFSNPPLMIYKEPENKPEL